MKYLLTTLVSVLALTVATPAFAGTLTLTPATISPRTGQSFTLTLTANPQTEANYTVKAGVTFSADALEVTGFALNSAWTPLVQPGYDSTDNTAGSLVKTGAYPKGFSTPTTFGTITFRVKKAGSATVAVAGTSMMLNASSANTYTGASTVTVTVPGIVVSFDTPTPTPAPRVVVRATATPSLTPTPTPEPVEFGTPSPTPNPELATIGTGFTSTGWFKGIMVVAIGVLLWLWFTRRRTT
jgi:hypothetical protein